MNIESPLKRSEKQKEIGIKNLKNIKEILVGIRVKGKKIDIDKNDLDFNLNPRLMNYKELEKYGHYFTSIGEHIKAYNFFRRADSLKIGATEFKKTYPPKDTISSQKTPTEAYVDKYESIPDSLSKKIVVLVFHTIMRTKETDRNELKRQIEFSIDRDLKTDEVRFSADPLSYAYNRVAKLLREGKWERPLGYVDIQTIRENKFKEVNSRKKENDKKNDKVIFSKYNFLD